MKKRLRQLYWVGVLITLLMAAAAVAMLVTVKISDTKEDLHHMLDTASAWALESGEDLDALAHAIADIAPPVRVTFLMDMGLILADSAPEEAATEGEGTRPEVVEAIRGELGESLRLSASRDVVMLYAAKRISPQLILRLGYPVQELTHLLTWYAAGLAVLFLVLFLLQRHNLRHLANALVRQMEDVRRLLEGEQVEHAAVFPEFSPAMHNIGYLIERMDRDRQEILRTQNLRGDFVANASHELRSPLTSIMGFAEMLDEGLVDTPEEQALCTQMIRSECERMLEVIEDILLLSRAEHKPVEKRTRVNVTAVAEEICKALAQRAREKNITLHLEGEMQIDAAEKDIWEILYNLTDNAVRYGRENGLVRIVLSKDAIAVEDDGIGIDREHLPRIFEQFYRVDEMRDTGVRGTGLGLSIVRAIAQRYGGSVQVESEPGRGSRFTVCLGGKEETA